LGAQGHSSARQAGQAAREIGAQKLFICGTRAQTPDEVAALCQEASETFGKPALFPQTDHVYEI